MKKAFGEVRHAEWIQVPLPIPEYCSDCYFSHTADTRITGCAIVPGKEYYLEKVIDTGRPDWCPIVEIPKN